MSATPTEEHEDTKRLRFLAATMLSISVAAFVQQDDGDGLSAVTIEPPESRMIGLSLDKLREVIDTMGAKQMTVEQIMEMDTIMANHAMTHGHGGSVC